MTIISAVITQHYTAHASDSFLTAVKPDGTLAVKQSQRTKLVFVRPWRGALAYWGLAVHGSWSTLDWLRSYARRAAGYDSAEAFANALASDLNKELNGRPFVKDLDKGIGIHFTAYEHVDDYWIPELFLISNFTDPSYAAVHRAISVSRHTYGTIKQVSPAPGRREPGVRKEVHQSLLRGAMFVYNNGDPTLFNPAANGIAAVFRRLSERRILDKPESWATHCALARRPIELVSTLLADFSKEGRRHIGGRPHDLCISPKGDCWSTTGDSTK